MYGALTAIVLLLSFGPVEAAQIPAEVQQRLRFLIHSEAESQLRLARLGGCSDGDAFDSAERNLSLLEQTLTLANVGKVDKYNKLIDFFKEKLTRKCCELSGKSIGDSGGGSKLGQGGGRGFGRGRNGGGGRGRNRGGQ